MSGGFRPENIEWICPALNRLRSATAFTPIRLRFCWRALMQASVGQRTLARELDKFLLYGLPAASNHIYRMGWARAEFSRKVTARSVACFWMVMRFILYCFKSKYSPTESSERMAYDYTPLLSYFRPVLDRLGDIDVVNDPRTEVDPLFDLCQAEGEACVFICFAPPYELPQGLRCPTMIVFAPGVFSAPAKTRPRRSQNDWRSALARCKHVVALSSYSAQLLKEEIGADFPISVIAPPVWDRCANTRMNLNLATQTAVSNLCARGIVMDSLAMGFSVGHLISSVRPLKRSSIRNIRESVLGKISDIYSAYRRSASRKAQWKIGKKDYPEFQTRLEGVIYTGFLDPTDKSRDWNDTVTAFCWAFRETPDATLILKVNSDEHDEYRETFIQLLSRLDPFLCRVLIIQADLDASAYEQLLGATTYYVNASEREDLCLSMMEFMACGRPPIAPSHTAIKDYIDSESAFVLQCSGQRKILPYDTQNKSNVRSYRLNWESLLTAYRESYKVAKAEPGRYAAMSRAAAQRIHDIASDELIGEKLHSLFSAQASSEVYEKLV
jgi:glycosyltransferase involved in cell wall biosynthesis